jgi:hypothetical protein
MGCRGRDKGNGPRVLGINGGEMDGGSGCATEALE